MLPYFLGALCVWQTKFENLFASVYESHSADRVCQEKNKTKLNKIYDFHCWWAIIYLILLVGHLARRILLTVCDSVTHATAHGFFFRHLQPFLCSPSVHMLVLHILLLVEGKAAQKTYWNRNESTDWYVRQCVSWFRVSFFVFVISSCIIFFFAAGYRCRAQVEYVRNGMNATYEFMMHGKLYMATSWCLWKASSRWIRSVDRKRRKQSQRRSTIRRRIHEKQKKQFFSRAGLRFDFLLFWFQTNSHRLNRECGNRNIADSRKISIYVFRFTTL